MKEKRWKVVEARRADLSRTCLEALQGPQEKLGRGGVLKA